jgi:hypothetical protein
MIDALIRGQGAAQISVSLQGSIDFPAQRFAFFGVVLQNLMRLFSLFLQMARPQGRVFAHLLDLLLNLLKIDSHDNPTG